MKERHQGRGILLVNYLTLVISLLLPSATSASSSQTYIGTFYLIVSSTTRHSSKHLAYTHLFEHSTGARLPPSPHSQEPKMMLRRQCVLKAAAAGFIYLAVT